MMPAPLVLRTLDTPVELRTQRVLLRKWTDDDLEPWCEMNADPEVRKYFSGVATRDAALGEASRIRNLIARRGWGMWALDIPGKQSFAGFVGLGVPAIDLEWMPRVEIGWRLPKAAWHGGYATEGAKAVLHFAFNTLELDEVVAMTAVQNEPSRRVMNRIGMQYDADADFDHPAVPEGSPVRRHVLYRIRRERFIDP